MKKITIDLKIIGTVHSQYKNPSDVPIGKKEHISMIEIDKKLIDGLVDIDGFTHLHIFYWLHKTNSYSLTANPPMDIKPHGLFATRSPHRPNPIAHSVVELIKRKNNILYVKGLDAIEGTPVFDIKPYIKKNDCKKDSKSGWLENINSK